MTVDFAECDRARLARDPSYDWRFFTGVRTRGVLPPRVPGTTPIRERALLPVCQTRRISALSSLSARNRPVLSSPEGHPRDG
jgi:hypothetical protein